MSITESMFASKEDYNNYTGWMHQVRSESSQVPSGGRWESSDFSGNRIYYKAYDESCLSYLFHCRTPKVRCVEVVEKATAKDKAVVATIVVGIGVIAAVGAFYFFPAVSIPIACCYSSHKIGILGKIWHAVKHAFKNGSGKINITVGSNS